MGFDVTFHPISRDQLHRYFFDVIDDPSKAEARAKQISPDPKRQDVVLRLYNAFPHWFADNAPVGASFAFGAAILAGFLHPYWYARGQAFTFLAEEHVPEMASLFSPLGMFTSGRIGDLKDDSRGMISGNESASGLIPSDRIALAEGLLESLASVPGRGGLSKFETVVDEDSLRSMRAALRYFREKGLGLIEASDVVVPIADENMTDPANLRAAFLNKMDP